MQCCTMTSQSSEYHPWEIFQSKVKEGAQERISLCFCMASVCVIYFGTDVNSIFWLQIVRVPTYKHRDYKLMSKLVLFMKSQGDIFNFTFPMKIRSLGAQLFKTILLDAWSWESPGLCLLALRFQKLMAKKSQV